jgi:hypothetical protein
MSRIYDAIRCAQESRSRNELDGSDFLGEMTLPERRVATRKELGVDLTVYGRSAGESVFYEQAKAILGNANGGVFWLPIPVMEGQDLFLINNSNSQEQICNVVSVLADNIGTCEVRVRFPIPKPDFWKPTGAARNS